MRLDARFGPGLELFNGTSELKLVAGKVYFPMPPPHYPVTYTLSVPGRSEAPVVFTDRDYAARGARERRHDRGEGLRLARGAQHGDVRRDAGVRLVPLRRRALRDRAGVAALEVSCVGDTQRLGPAAEPDPAAVNLGTVGVGQSRLYSVSVRSAGSESLAIASATSSHATLTVTPSPTLPASVSPYSSVGLALKLSPTATGAISATVTVATNDPRQPTGRGASGRPRRSSPRAASRSRTAT